MCKIKVNTDYRGNPKAILSFGGKTADIFSKLSTIQQKRIKKSYDLEMDVSLPIKIIRTIFPNEWALNLQLRRQIRKLPIHRVTVPWTVLK